MRSLNRSEVSTILSALASHARSQIEAADEFSGKDCPPLLAEMESDLRESAERSEALRSEFAGELHRLGGTDCELAHGDRPCFL